MVWDIDELNKSGNKRGVKRNRNSIYTDTGCVAATCYLGRQSRCLECPFPKCKDERNIPVVISKGNV